MISLESLSLEDRRVRVFPASYDPSHRDSSRPVSRGKQLQVLDDSIVQENEEKQILSSDEHQYAVLEKKPKKKKRPKSKTAVEQETPQKAEVHYSVPHQKVKKQNSGSKSDDQETSQTVVQYAMPDKKAKKPKPESELESSQSTEVQTVVQYAMPDKKAKKPKPEIKSTSELESSQSTEVQYAIPQKKKKTQKSENKSDDQETPQTPEVQYSLPLVNVQTTNTSSNDQSAPDQTDDKDQKDSVPDVIPRNVSVSSLEKPTLKKRKEQETVGKPEAEYSIPHTPGKALMPPADKKKLVHQYANVPPPIAKRTDVENSSVVYSLPITPGRQTEAQASTQLASDKTTPEDQLLGKQDSNGGLSVGSKEKHYYVNTGWSQQQSGQKTQPKAGLSIYCHNIMIVMMYLCLLDRRVMV